MPGREILGCSPLYWQSLIGIVVGGCSPRGDCAETSGAQDLRRAGLEDLRAAAIKPNPLSTKKSKP